MKKNLRCPAGYGILLLLLAAMLIINLYIGSVSVTVGEIGRILMGQEVTGAAASIIMSIRLPRLMGAALLGGALAVSGFCLQTFFGNPIAGPYVLGISSGAKLAVALTMIFCMGSGTLLTSTWMIGAAFLGSLLVMGFILLISVRVRNMAVLIICGVMVGYICSAITDFAVTFADDSNIVNLHNWSMGSFSGISMDHVKVILAAVLFAMAGVFLLSKPMSAYQLGEAYASNMGVKLGIFRVELILLTSLLSACVTAFAGPVSFVGIAVPQLMKRLMGTAKPIHMIPACFLGGASFCLFCDLLARCLFAPTELSISSVTSVFGAPVVIWLMLARRKESLN